MKPGKRAVIDALGEDPMSSIEQHLHVEDQPPPDPSALRATDVIVAVKSASIAWVDLLMTSGQYQHAPPLPYCPGLEYSGEVVWKGAEVERVAVGDRVIADGLLTGPRSKGDYQRYGGFASYTVAPQDALIHLPERFSYDQGASFLGNYETAYHCLIHCGELRPKETVLILGASGASGLAAVHLAKLVGATIIAVGRSPEKLAIVQKQGADHVVVAGALRDEVKALTSGKGVDVVYDAVGGATSIESLRCVAFGARFLIVGWASTPDVARGKGERGAPNANQLPTNLILIKGLKVIGCPMAISTHRDPSIRIERLSHLMDWASSGKITPVVSATFKLADVKEAMRAKWESRHVGACVLHPE